MPKLNPANERIKRDYFEYLREAKRLSPASVDAAAKAISRFEESTGWKDFRAFHIKQAIAFKSRLANQDGARTGQALSKGTLYSTLQALRSFFLWLAGRPGFKSRIAYPDAEYFNLSDKEVQIAKAAREKAVPTLAQVHHVLRTMSADSDIERRDRALVAFAALTGARDGALASFRLKHVDLDTASVLQDAREVRTKFSKTFRTTFFPIGGPAMEILHGWIEHLRQTLLWCDDEPLFPSTLVEVSADRRFEATGLSRQCWGSAAPIRRIFRAAFQQADLPYFKPHSFRDMIAQFGERVCRSPEELKAWSQNLGHERMMTTIFSYGNLPASRQAEIMRGLGRAPDTETEKIAQVLARAGYRLERVEGK